MSARAADLVTSLVAQVRAVFSATTDPLTGDHLTAGEHVSWAIQHRMRRWSFLGIITGATLVCWATRNPTVLTWWNLAASYGALVIEGITAMALINQTMRDAVVSRSVRAMEEQNLRMEQEHGEMLAAIHATICASTDTSGRSQRAPTTRRTTARRAEKAGKAS